MDKLYLRFVNSSNSDLLTFNLSKLSPVCLSMESTLASQLKLPAIFSAQGISLSRAMGCCMSKPTELESSPPPSSGEAHGEEERMSPVKEDVPDEDVKEAAEEAQSTQPSDPVPMETTPSGAEEDKSKGSPKKAKGDSSDSSEDGDDDDRGTAAASPLNTEGRVKIVLMSGADRQRDNCPYCDTPGGDFNDIIVIYGSVDHQFIEDMMDHSWWRTGNVLYRPRQKEVCCPAYTVRLDIDGYKFTKGHRRVMRKFAQFLQEGDPRWPPDAGAEAVEESKPSEANMPGDDGMQVDSTDKEEAESPIQQVDVKSVLKIGHKRHHDDSTKETSGSSRDPHHTSDAPLEGGKQMPSTTCPKPCGHGKGEGKSLREMLHDEESLVNPKHVLTMELHPVNPPSPRFRETMEDSYALYERFQDVVHPGKLKFRDYKQFQWGFCDSCMPNVVEGDFLLGTFHQQYYLDGRLVAVSVIDILPSYFVSIYLYYEPDIRFTQPGIYTILREVDFVHRLQKLRPELRYYDLGYYHHFSPKMSYKRQFRPAQVLCPYTLKWCDLDACIPLMKQRECVRFNDEPGDYAQTEEERAEAISNAAILCVSDPVKLRSLPGLFRSIMKEYAELLYEQTSGKMLEKFIIYMI